MGTVVRQIGKRKLQAEGVISVMPHCRFVPLPSDVTIIEAKKRWWLTPSPKKKFFITSDTLSLHIIIEAEDLPLLKTGS